MVKLLIFTKIGAEFQCKEGYGQRTNVHKSRTRIPMLERIRSECKCFTKMRPEFQSSEG